MVMRKQMVDRAADFYWIGGSPCSGKTSVADALAARHRLAQYNCDDAFYRHQALITPDEFPVWCRLARATSEELWVLRRVERQVEEEIALYHEEFPLILNDLASMPKDLPVIVEGAALLPPLLARAGIPRHRAIWIVPTEEFQREHYARREWRHDVVKECSDPDIAWENWMARDAGFARVVAAEAESLGFRVLTIDGCVPLAETVKVVEEHFGL
jgi:hypothetical protein